MPIHKLKLLNKKNVANNTVQFEFEKPAGFNFIPGQYGGFTLINPAEVDPVGITRRFSLLSTPDDPTIAIAMRIQSSIYKKMLQNMTAGQEIKFAGPTGNFILHEDQQTPTVLIAGGIGITPFYSMVQFSYKHQPQRKIYLFYGNRSPADTAFLSELQRLEQRNPNFKFIPVMEQSSDWPGETGYITHSLMKKYLPEINTPIFYVCGAAAMVTALQETLLEMEIPAEHIKVEDFPGY